MFQTQGRTRTKALRQEAAMSRVEGVVGEAREVMEASVKPRLGLEPLFWADGKPLEYCKE